MAGAGDNIVKSIVSRIEAVNAEIADLQADRAVIFAEGKVMGLNPKALREVIRLRKMSSDALAERNELLAQYGSSLGMDLL